MPFPIDRLIESPCHAQARVHGFPVGGAENKTSVNLERREFWGDSKMVYYPIDYEQRLRRALQNANRVYIKRGRLEKTKTNEV